MNITPRKLLGWTLLALPFAAIYVAAIFAQGFVVASLCMAVAPLIVGIVKLGVHLTSE